MSKKKDFKGVARSIMSNSVSSLDDFLASDKTPKEPDKEKIVEKSAEPLSKVQVSPKKEPKPEPPIESPQPKSRVEKSTPIETEESKRVRISLNVSTDTVHLLDQLKTDIRRLIPVKEIRSVSKSSIIDAAIEILASDFKKNELNSKFVQKILNR